jgi:hypothetical protein
MSCPDNRPCAEIRHLAGILRLIVAVDHPKISPFVARALAEHEATYGPLPQPEDHP